MWFVFCKHVLSFDLFSMGFRMSSLKDIVEAKSHPLVRVVVQALRCTITVMQNIRSKRCSDNAEVFDFCMRVLQSFIEQSLDTLTKNLTFDCAAVPYQIVSHMLQLLQQSVLLNYELQEFMTPQLFARLV